MGTIPAPPRSQRWTGNFIRLWQRGHRLQVLCRVQQADLPIRVAGCPLWVKRRKTRLEHLSSAYHPIVDARADIPERQLRAISRPDGYVDAEQINILVKGRYHRRSGWSNSSVIFGLIAFATAISAVPSAIFPLLISASPRP